ncbi:uncharacterized protein TRUGW13939_08557 [Talaromyces rugulosus]|uniref:Uncharacterized protein n=1 Tax=Talaromyces rugulosus TaxID=121627 RepID=A0A7H8R4U7_TALRU|nr:uncharacterized protein TRUGW13939_08557 [Talaromyces rugulosus]QKX61409.1 hypothetical protein TRUGW13939_08557 [Talaromyces rugulosus]
MRFSINSGFAVLAVLSFASVGKAVSGRWGVAFTEDATFSGPQVDSFGNSVPSGCVSVDTRLKLQSVGLFGDGPYWKVSEAGWDVFPFESVDCSSDEERQVGLSEEGGHRASSVGWNSFEVQWLDAVKGYDE